MLHQILNHILSTWIYCANRTCNLDMIWPDVNENLQCLPRCNWFSISELGIHSTVMNYTKHWRRLETLTGAWNPPSYHEHDSVWTSIMNYTKHWRRLETLTGAWNSPSYHEHDSVWTSIQSWTVKSWLSPDFNTKLNCDLSHTAGDVPVSFF